VDSLESAPAPAGVLLVADDLDLAEAFGLLFDLDDRFVVLATVTGVTAAGEAVRRRAPNVVVVDLDRRDGGGGAIQYLRRRAPDARIVAISSFPDPFTLFGVLRQGADAYLDKATAWTDLIPTVCELCDLPGARHPADA
jgi:DNA-binding NarL/FixJ family response regulator